MNSTTVKRWFKTNEIDVSTLSFYVKLDSRGDVIDSSDTEFGKCDVSRLTGALVNCVALTTDGGDAVQLQILETLVSGVVGKLAGAL